MTIKPVCDRCGRELDEFGALLLSPPTSGNMVRKYHLCKSCYNSIIKEFGSQQA